MKRKAWGLITLAFMALFLFTGCLCGKSEQAAPTLAIDHKTDTVIVVKAVSGAEYSKNNGGAWQDSNVFSGLTPNTTYKVTARLKETDKMKVSPSATVQNVTTSTYVGGMQVTKAPSVVLNHGEDVTFTGGKIAYKLSYGDREYFSEIDINEEWLEADVANKTFTVNYEGETINGTFQADYGLGQSKVATVTNAAQLTSALRSETVEFIVLNEGTYELAASGTTTYVENPKTIIGKGNAKIKITGQVSSQASIIFKDNVTIKNIAFENVDEKAPVKFSTITAPVQKIDKIRLDNVRVTGKSGINIHGAKAVEFKNVSITLDNDSYGVALAIREGVVSLYNSTIGKGTWGSAGVMYGAGDDLSSRLSADSATTFTGTVYVENYPAYLDEEITVVTGLTGWTFNVNERDQGIYTKP